MGKTAMGYVLGGFLLHLLSGFVLAADSNTSAYSKFGIQQFSDKDKKVAPPFTLKTMEGSQVSLSSFKGKPVIFTFWA